MNLILYEIKNIYIYDFDISKNIFFSNNKFIILKKTIILIIGQNKKNQNMSFIYIIQILFINLRFEPPP